MNQKLLYCTLINQATVRATNKKGQLKDDSCVTAMIFFFMNK